MPICIYMCIYMYACLNIYIPRNTMPPSPEPPHPNTNNVMRAQPNEPYTPTPSNVTWPHKHFVPQSW